MPTLSVLDQSPIPSGGTASGAVRDTLALAAAADRLGYHRYWLAEHHATPALAGSAPEILIGRIAAATTGLRVGSGGVMLSHYSPLKVAETFRMLETLFPGRIDLGLGRAPGSDLRTARALTGDPRSLDPAGYPGKVETLLGYLHDRLPLGHLDAGIVAMPAVPRAPEVWLLGSSDQSAALAAHFGTAFSYAHFITGRGAESALLAYTRAFRPSPSLAVPRASLAVFVLCADTEAEAERLARSRDLFLLWLHTGRIAPYPSVAEAEAYPCTDQERALIQHARPRSIVGAPEQVRDRLQALGAACDVDEFVVLTIAHDFAARLRSYELLAQAFDLPRREPSIPPLAPVLRGEGKSRG
jgi:luciferase family oxidoreductase group 1